MRGQPLDVEQASAAGGAQVLDEPEQGRLEAPLRRWNFDSAANRPPIADAVEPAREALLVPCLDRVGPAEPMQALVGCDEPGVDPAVRPAGVCAAPDHIREGGVEAEVVASCRAAEGARGSEAGKRDHRPARG